MFYPKKEPSGFFAGDEGDEKKLLGLQVTVFCGRRPFSCRRFATPVHTGRLYETGRGHDLELWRKIERTTFWACKSHCCRPGENWRGYCLDYKRRAVL